MWSEPFQVCKSYTGWFFKLRPSTWSAVPLPLVSSDTAAGGSMILLPFKEVSIQSLANGFQKLNFRGPGFGFFWPKLTEAVNTKPSYVMCSQFFYTQWISCFERADFVFSGLQIGWKQLFQKEKTCKRLSMRGEDHSRRESSALALREFHALKGGGCLKKCR